MNRAEEIAAQLRVRIESGRLRPGDRAPSTRAIMRDHSVAMGTATRVLALLQADGLIDSAPGRGSVVRTPDQSPAALTTADVLRVAIEIADSESLTAVTMRRLSGALGIPTMAVYRYVHGKEHLHNGMLDHVFGELELPTSSGDWRRDIEAALRAVWDSMVTHPWLAGALSMTRPGVVPNAMPVTERILAALCTAGLPDSAAFTEYLCLLTMIRGLGMTIEPELAARAETGVTEDEWIDEQLDAFRAAAPSEQFPVMARLLHSEYPYDTNALFRNATTRYLDGLATRT